MPFYRIYKTPHPYGHRFFIRYFLWCEPTRYVAASIAQIDADDRAFLPNLAVLRKQPSEIDIRLAPNRSRSGNVRTGNTPPDISHAGSRPDFRRPGAECGAGNVGRPGLGSWNPSESMKGNGPIIILGGGVAGLSVGYYAKLAGIPFSLFEKSGRVGGNCITLRHGDFLFDSGAHRIHDSDPRITRDLQDLLGKDLMRVEAPSRIFHQGNFIDFPLSPLNLLLKLGFAQSLRAVRDLALGRITVRDRLSNFESFALATYGRTVAEKFLLGYSEKLWGLPAARLSPSIAGKRLKGLDIRTFVREAVFGKKAKTDHLEGMRFYYPRGGFGEIPQRLAESCGPERIFLNSEVNRVLHEGGRLVAVGIDSNGIIEVGQGQVASTLPVGSLIRALEPRAPEPILRIAETLQYRHMVLAVFFVDRPSFTKNATIYIPDPDLPFTRIYEPKNRSAAMSPPDRTCLVFEIPCRKTDACWTKDDEETLDLVRSRVIREKWLEDREIIGGLVYRFECAYPILENGYERKLDVLLEYLSAFRNLHSAGRNGLFAYSWLPDIMRTGRDIVGSVAAAEGAVSRE